MSSSPPPKPKVLIIGCGAVGLLQGYHLSSGAQITYLVRPGRTPAFLPPKTLYNYRTDSLHTFSGYRVVESAADLAGEEFEFVLDTLDGASAQSEQGVATLSAVGQLIRDVERTFVVYDALGAEIEEHYSRTLGIARRRVIFGISAIAHQRTPMISVRAPASEEKAARADLLYVPFGKDTGLLVVDKEPGFTARLEKIYNVNGALKIQRGSQFVAEVALLIVVQLMVWGIQGWEAWPALKQDRELWTLLVRAEKEFLCLPRFGWKGWVLSWLMGSWATGKMIEAPMKDVGALVYHEFNAFHHGKKVTKQDLLLLEGWIAEGEEAKLKMPALREVCQRARKKLEG